jgi:O-antigen/teichoic acid export membrane protein
MKIIKGLSWVFFANIIVAFSKWLMVILIANFLSPREVGIYTLAFAIGAPITLFANMKLRSLYITEEKENFTDYIAARNAMSILALIILCLVGGIIYPQYFFIIILVGLSKILDLQSDMYYALPHKSSQMSEISKLMILKHLVMLIAFSLSLFITKNLTFSLIIMLVAQVLILYFVEILFIRKKHHYKAEIKSKNIKIILLLGLPLGAVQMLVSINTSFPRYLLEYFTSPDVLGYFAAIAYIMTIGNMFMSSISQNFLPIISNEFKGKNYLSVKNLIFVKLTIFSALLGIILILFSYTLGEYFLELVYGQEYADYTDILIILSYAMTINFIGWNFDTGLMATKYISVQPKITLFVLLITVIISPYLIINNGIYGAAYTLLLTNSIQLILKVYFLNKRLNHLLKKEV